MFTDINECIDSTNNCHGQATCTNTAGSFICDCNDGYTGDGTTCTGNNTKNKLSMCHLYKYSW